MLLCIEQITLPRTVNNEPVFQSDPVIAHEFQSPIRFTIGACLGKPGERRDRFTGLINEALIGEPLPFEATLF